MAKSLTNIMETLNKARSIGKIANEPTMTNPDSEKITPVADPAQMAPAGSPNPMDPASQGMPPVDPAMAQPQLAPTMPNPEADKEAAVLAAAEALVSADQDKKLATDTLIDIAGAAATQADMDIAKQAEMFGMIAGQAMFETNYLNTLKKEASDNAYEIAYAYLTEDPILKVASEVEPLAYEDAIEDLEARSTFVKVACDMEDQAYTAALAYLVGE